MTSKDIKWAFALKVGDEVLYKHTDCNKKSTIKKSKVSEITIKCIYVDGIRFRKDTEAYIYKSVTGTSVEIARLLNPNKFSTEEMLAFKKEALINEIINRKLLNNLTLEELINITDYSAHLKVAGSIVPVRHHLEVG